MCYVLVNYNTRTGANCTGCADCPYRIDCAIDDDPDMPF